MGRRTRAHRARSAHGGHSCQLVTLTFHIVNITVNQYRNQQQESRLTTPHLSFIIINHFHQSFPPIQVFHFTIHLPFRVPFTHQFRYFISPFTLPFRVPFTHQFRYFISSFTLPFRVHSGLSISNCKYYRFLSYHTAGCCYNKAL